PPEPFLELENEGKTVVCVGTDEELLGVIAISDRIRPEAETVIAHLHDAGIEVVIITGDNDGTARSVAEELSIDHYHSELLPEDKVAEIEHLKKEYGSIAMVGDGINDAPALAKADVGIAMGAAGSDTAIETADIALMGDNLNHVVYAVRLSRQGERIIQQNIISSIGVKLFLALGVIPGFVNLITAVLVGDMAVTFGITGNAMRLRGIQSQE
ncbi:MAG: HAD-IC family P-type ATPase, partial [bacterium]